MVTSILYNTLVNTNRTTTDLYYILKTFVVSGRTSLALQISTDFKLIKVSELPILDRYSTGSAISKHEITSAFKVQELLKKEVLHSTNDEEIEILEDFTSDYGELKNTINNIEFKDRETYLTDILYDLIIIRYICVIIYTVIMLAVIFMYLRQKNTYKRENE